MDDVRKAQAGPIRLHPQTPANFVPLRLVLHPGGASIEADRPEMVVGRHTECDIRLPLPDVSRRHCRLQFVEGCWQVIDLNSLNGIQVNGDAVLQAPLEQGDLLKIGGFLFEVDLGQSGGNAKGALDTLSGLIRRKAS